MGFSRAGRLRAADVQQTSNAVAYAGRRVQNANVSQDRPIVRSCAAVPDLASSAYRRDRRRVKQVSDLAGLTANVVNTIQQVTLLGFDTECGDLDVAADAAVWSWLRPAARWRSGLRSFQ
jgi:hypothetical protein